MENALEHPVDDGLEDAGSVVVQVQEHSGGDQNNASGDSEFLPSFHK